MFVVVVCDLFSRRGDHRLCHGRAKRASLIEAQPPLALAASAACCLPETFGRKVRKFCNSENKDKQFTEGWRSGKGRIEKAQAKWLQANIAICN